jgi:leader peptidase (prepilin peptidase) / N-methyltransferase
MPDWFLWIVAGLVGGAIGSFLNVCICRWPEEESVVRPPSHCPECSTPIGWRDNIPVLSYLMLRGRCRACGTGISVLYPVIELVTALVWVAAVVRHGLSWDALIVAVFFTILLGIAVTDARTYLIPDEFSLGGLALGLLLALTPGGVTFTQSLAGAALGFGLLYLTAKLGEWWLDKPAMGGGDIKMMAMVGAFLGPLGAVLTIFLGALVGTLVFLPISLRTKKLVPFGIFLALGAAVTEVWGGSILDWYRGVILGM